MNAGPHPAGSDAAPHSLAAIVRRQDTALQSDRGGTIFRQLLAYHMLQQSMRQMLPAIVRYVRRKWT